MTSTDSKSEKSFKSAFSIESLTKETVSKPSKQEEESGKKVPEVKIESREPNKETSSNNDLQNNLMNILSQFLQQNNSGKDAKNVDLKQYPQEIDAIEEKEPQNYQFTNLDNNLSPSELLIDPNKKKTRTVFSRSQIFRLESMFELKRYLSSSERSSLAKNLNLTETQVKIWFQNRRNKWKRQSNLSSLTNHSEVNQLIQQQQLSNPGPFKLNNSSCSNALLTSMAGNIVSAAAAAHNVNANKNNVPTALNSPLITANLLQSIQNLQNNTFPVALNAAFSNQIKSLIAGVSNNLNSNNNGNAQNFLGGNTSHFSNLLTGLGIAAEGKAVQEDEESSNNQAIAVAAASLLKSLTNNSQGINK